MQLVVLAPMERLGGVTLSDLYEELPGVNVLRLADELDGLENLRLVKRAGTALTAWQPIQDIRSSAG